MAGIYFHIPFCKTRCVYCDFFSSTKLNKKEEYVAALCRELQVRKNYLKGHKIDTIYFGGGTPSQLSAQNFEAIFHALHRYYDIFPAPDIHDLEVTLEANPEDITPEYLKSIKHLPFNRISIGIQSFDDKELQFLNRRHDAQSAARAVKLCRNSGFRNISIDLMYGLPGQNAGIWEKNLNQAVDLDIQHISAYHLTYEEETPIFHLLEKGDIHPVDEELSLHLFEILIDKLTASGFEHYEISNFAKFGYRSKHNSSYWNGTPYLGVGASAHSYNGTSRQWNPRTTGAEYPAQAYEIELIDDKKAYNDFIITRLRTCEGIDLTELSHLFKEDRKAYCQEQAQPYLADQSLELFDHHLRLTRKGIFISDGIMSDLMM